MKINLTELKRLFLFLLATLFFWIVTFSMCRVIFVALNSIKAVDTPLPDLFMAVCRGWIFDVSIWGYISILVCVVFALVVWLAPTRHVFKVVSFITAVLASLVVFLLPAESIVYGVWGYHVDAPSLRMVAERPTLLFASTETWFEVVYCICCSLLVVIDLWFLRKILSFAKVEQQDCSALNIKEKVVSSLVAIVVGAALIIPIRGGVGIAPLNSGKAFFSNYIFANHVALNPVWNFIYSLKRLKAADTSYNFMSQDDANALFDSLMVEEGSFPSIFTSERPNVLVVLLESFSAHGIEYLGGVNATPNLDSLRHDGLYFNNFFSSSDRSGKGLAAVFCGQPSLPNLRIIQYPEKTQALPQIAQKLRGVGYSSQCFVYGGDINFNNFNSLVNLAGFDRVISQDDFSSDQLGDKWGAHDQFAFDKLLQTMDQQSQPFYDFIFTLSSHEPFTVPMERVFDNDYINSMCYTDRCLGDFIRAARQKDWWNNTVIILVADHGHGGPNQVGFTDRMKFNIPLIIMGGGVAVKDSCVSSYGCQTDIARTLLDQLGVDASDFKFSKNLLDSTAKDFAFFDFTDGFGFVTPDNYQVFDNQLNDFIRIDNRSLYADTLSGKAYLQVLTEDFHSRGRYDK